MKKIIISLDHVMGAIEAAYEREMKIKSIGCSTDEDGRMILKFSLIGSHYSPHDMIQTNNNLFHNL